MARSRGAHRPNRLRGGPLLGRGGPRRGLRVRAFFIIFHDFSMKIFSFHAIINFFLYFEESNKFFMIFDESPAGRTTPLAFC